MTSITGVSSTSTGSPACASNCRSCATTPTVQYRIELLRDAVLDGLRTDHTDGLLDPKEHLLCLRDRAPRPFYLVVEKILARRESLRPDWPCRRPHVKGLTLMVNSIFNGWRMEDVWLDQ